MLLRIQALVAIVFSRFRNFSSDANNFVLPVESHQHYALPRTEVVVCERLSDQNEAGIVRCMKVVNIIVIQNRCGHGCDWKNEPERKPIDWKNQKTDEYGNIYRCDAVSERRPKNSVIRGEEDLRWWWGHNLPLIPYQSQQSTEMRIIFIDLEKLLYMDGYNLTDYSQT